jgi:hypothetical protein
MKLFRLSLIDALIENRPAIVLRQHLHPTAPEVPSRLARYFCGDGSGIASPSFRGSEAP